MTNDNELFTLSSGIDPLELIEQYGAPLYVYDTAIIKRQYRRMVDAFKVPKLSIHYACKANANLNILKYLRQLGAGIDAVSIQEVEAGLKAGFAANDIMYTPSGVSLEEIEMAVARKVRINLDSISVLEQFGHHHPDVPVCIRVNPHIMAGGHTKISTGHLDSKFGISIHQMPHVWKIVETTGIRIEGIHMHTGSDILDAEAFLQAMEVLLTAARGFKHLDYIDFGSGFKVPYRPGDVETDIEEMGERLSERFIQFCEEYGRELTLVFEPGKFLVSQCGYFFARVNVVKPTPSTVFVGLDTGMNHLIRPMFYNAYHHLENISRPDGKPRIYSVVGYICETDTFANNRKIAEVHEGDILCFYNAGAYCFSMSSNYNSRYRPAEVMVHEGTHYLIRKRETMEDILRNQVLVKF